MRKCPRCSAKLVQKPGEAPQNFKVRVFCGEKCRLAETRERFWMGPRQAPEPRKTKGPKTDNPEIWLKHNKPTILPPGYAMGTYTFPLYHQTIFGKTR